MPFNIKDMLRNVGKSVTEGAKVADGDWSNFQSEIEALVAAVVSGDTAAEIKAKQRLSEIEESLGEEQGRYAREFYENSLLDSLPIDSGNDEQVKAAKAAINSSLALAGVKTGTGIWQILDAKFKEEGLKAPNFPEPLSKNNVLSDRLAESMAREKSPDRAISAEFERGLAALTGLNNARAQSTGNIGQYQGNLQANRVRENDALLRFAAEQERTNAGERQETNRLLSESIGEDRYRQDELWKQFGVLDDRHNQSLANLARQRSSGFNNMFIGLNELADGYAQSKSLPQMNAMQAALMGAPSNQKKMAEYSDNGNSQLYDGYFSPTGFPERQPDNPWEFPVDEYDKLTKFNALPISGFPF